jgi:hypothetical protein
VFKAVSGDGDADGRGPLIDGKAPCQCMSVLDFLPALLNSPGLRQAVFGGLLNHYGVGTATLVAIN